MLVLGRISPVATIANARGMATLKEISMRLKSIQNIGKITKSMKMIASTKVGRAQRTMDAARVYGAAGVGLLKHTQTDDLEMKSPLLITCSSDRGLCGGIHSSLSKATKRSLIELPESTSAILGVKARAKLQYDFASRIKISFDGVCKYNPSWLEAATIADEILGQKVPSDGSYIIYNRFKSVIAFEPVTIKLPTAELIAEAPSLAAYEIEDDVIGNYQEFMVANTLYWALAEGYASEVTARRSAMENATKNADEMVKKLTLMFNRSRQAVITNDLCDIITGASALE
ncbi:ATPase, F1 complex, gamma subunit domain-containing protein [Globomyces pollinis-pini]|nr:ATPase, F1 complex, gamma subunit domain-containing protein [Globomyces pollinis-pini]KAJ2999605.1 atp3 gamma subunit of the F1 sector of mitochondrial F1F0 ATP synthase [Globomyces sp. JEL0801]